MANFRAQFETEGYGQIWFNKQQRHWWHVGAFDGLPDTSTRPEIIAKRLVNAIHGQSVWVYIGNYVGGDGENTKQITISPTPIDDYDLQDMHDDLGPCALHNAPLSVDWLVAFIKMCET